MPGWIDVGATLRVEQHNLYTLAIAALALNVFVQIYVYFGWFLCPVFILEYIVLSLEKQRALFL